MRNGECVFANFSQGQSRDRIDWLNEHRKKLRNVLGGLHTNVTSSFCSPSRLRHGPILTLFPNVFTITQEHSMIRYNNGHCWFVSCANEISHSARIILRFRTIVIELRRATTMLGFRLWQKTKVYYSLSAVLNNEDGEEVEKKTHTIVNVCVL